MRKILALIISSFFLMQVASAQLLNPVVWTFSETDLGGGQRELICQASIERDWHIYGYKPQDSEIVATTVHIREMHGARFVGKLMVESILRERYDEQFGKRLTLIENQIAFRQQVVITNPAEYLIEGYVRYMACNDRQCLAPMEEPFTFTNIDMGTGDSVATNTSSASPFAFQIIEEELPKEPENTLADNLLWRPVDAGKDGAQTAANFGELLVIFLQGLLGGLLALFTPCVWPVIPFTMSFFLKRSGNRRKGLRDALLYGISIIIIYVSLGLLVTFTLGASALNSLSTNAFFNLFFFALLIVFGVSFLGAFNIVLPASWASRVDSQAERSGGIWGIFLMAFTLALVSFSCTGPIIGTLLVAVAVEGSYLSPAVGMFGFATALAVPFALFALFPSILRSLPKSGSWLNTMKVSIGFLELALALKFLSVADLAYGWHILDREVFVAIWIVIFALWGIYLLGKIRLPHDPPQSQTGIVRLTLAMASFAFVFYLIPGLWGAPLKAISAFAPPLSTQDFNLYKNEVHARYNDYDLGMEHARRVKKPVLVDFSGFGCVNCRKMEASVWTDAEVSERLNNDFVLITLFVDDKTALPAPIEITENGKTRTLRTVGDKWSYLQRYKFKTNQQPYYVLLGVEGNLLAPSIAYTESVQEFLDFLDSAEK